MDEKVVKHSGTQERFIIVDGILTHIIEAGTGEPLVLVHGLGGPLMWQKIVKPLSKNFRVIVIDLPGFGDSDCPSSPFSSKMYAGFLIHCFDALSIQQSSVMGISYGGQIAVLTAQIYPARINKLILVASTGFKQSYLLKHKFVWQACSLIIDALILQSEWLMCLLARRSFFDIRSRPPDLCKKFYCQLQQNGKREAWLNVLRNIYTEESFENRLSAMSMPTLIVWGSEDKTINASSGKRFHQHILNSQVVMFSQCAHSVPLEKPDELCKGVISFTQQG